MVTKAPSQVQSLTLRGRKKKRVPVKAQLKCTWLLAASAEPDAASCTTGRNKAHLLRREGEAIHRIMAWVRQPQKFVKEILLCIL